MGISNLTSSVRGVSGQEEIYNIRRVQASSLKGDNITVTNATIGRAVITNATITNASINQSLVQNLVVVNATINNARIGTPSNNVVVSASGVTKFTGNAGLILGEIFAYDIGLTATNTGIGIANKVQIKAFNTNGVSKGMTPDHTQNHIIVNTPGYYRCSVYLHVESGGGAAFEAGFAIFKNNGASLLQNCHGHRNLSGGGGDTGSVAIGGIHNFAATDTIEVWVWNETNTNDMVIDDITLSLFQVGGNQ